jgi:hypothetical protein
MPLVPAFIRVSAAKLPYTVRLGGRYGFFYSGSVNRLELISSVHSSDSD